MLYMLILTPLFPPQSMEQRWELGDEVTGTGSQAFR